MHLKLCIVKTRNRECLVSICRIQFIAQVSSIFPLELERKRKSEVKQKAEESESESEEEKQEEVSNTFVPNFRA